MNRPDDLTEKEPPHIWTGAAGRRWSTVVSCGMLLCAAGIVGAHRQTRTVAALYQAPVRTTWANVSAPTVAPPEPLPALEPSPPVPTVAQPPTGDAEADNAVVSLLVKHGLPARVGTMLVAESRRYDLAPELVAAVIDLESGFDAGLTHVNPNGTADRGLMQLNDSTSPWLAVQVGIQPFDVTVDPYEPELNLRMGIWYLHWLTQRYHGDVEWTLLAYNQGFGAADRRAAAREQAGTAYTRAVARIATTLGYRGFRRPQTPPDATSGS